MFKIGEFSKLTQVSTRMLRYYDETGLLKPCVIDKFTNYRLYSAEQIFALNKILFLRDSGFNVSEIALILACLYKMTGQSRQVAHRGAWNEKNPENYLTEIQIPLEIRE